MPPLFGRTIVTLAVLPIIKELSLSLWAYAALSVNHLLSARKRACSPLIFSFRLIVTHNGHDGLLTKIRFAHKKDKNMRPSAINKDKFFYAVVFYYHPPHKNSFTLFFLKKALRFKNGNPLLGIDI